MGTEEGTPHCVESLRTHRDASGQCLSPLPSASRHHDAPRVEGSHGVGTGRTYAHNHQTKTGNRVLKVSTVARIESTQPAYGTGSPCVVLSPAPTGSNGYGDSEPEGAARRPLATPTTECVGVQHPTSVGDAWVKKNEVGPRMYCSCSHTTRCTASQKVCVGTAFGGSGRQRSSASGEVEHGVAPVNTLSAFADPIACLCFSH